MTEHNRRVALVTGGSGGIGRVVSLRLAKDGFSVVLHYAGNSQKAVAPGPIPTELFLKGKTEERIDEFRKMSPLERLGQPEDIAGVVSFLAGPDGAWVNGQVVRVNGGFA